MRRFLLFLWEGEYLPIGKVSVIPMGGGVPFYWEGVLLSYGRKVRYPIIGPWLLHCKGRDGYGTIIVTV